MATAKKAAPKKKAAKVKVPDTQIGIVLDMSGSMAPLVHDTLIGLNQYIKDTKQDAIDTGSKITLSLMQFDTVQEWVEKVTPAADVKEVTSEVYHPRGSTALYDAIGVMVGELDKTSTKTNRSYIVIITDGQENASREFTRENIKELISKKQNESWNFVYLGANQDSFLAAGAMGVKIGNIANYGVGDTRRVYTAMSVQRSAYTNSPQKIAASLNVDAAGNLDLSKIKKQATT